MGEMNSARKKTKKQSKGLTYGRNFIAELLQRARALLLELDLDAIRVVTLRIREMLAELGVVVLVIAPVHVPEISLGRCPAEVSLEHGRGFWPPGHPLLLVKGRLAGLRRSLASTAKAEG